MHSTKRIYEAILERMALPLGNDEVVALVPRPVDFMNHVFISVTFVLNCLMCRTGVRDADYVYNTNGLGFAEQVGPILALKNNLASS